MKTKTLTPEKMAKIAAKREKEIARLEKEKQKPKGKFYLPYLIFIISLIYLTDEVASQIGPLMKTEIANDLFARFGDSSVGLLDTLSMIAIPFQVLAIFYKPLSDKYGRKKFLFINTLGLGLGLFCVFLSNNIPLYVIGTCMIQFFVPHDMQVVYIMESVPSKHRARIYFTIKSFATMGIMLVPLLRRTLMADMSQWRIVFLVPAVIGLATSLIALFFARETDTFIDTRLKYLKMTDEERDVAKQEKDAASSQGGLINSLKFVLKHKQLKYLYLSTGLLNMGYLITMYYQVIISYGYAGRYGEVTDEILNQVSLNEVTSALIFFPIGSAVLQLLVGIFGDWLGRKKAAIIMSALCVLSFLGFTLGSIYGWPTVIVGLSAGACIGSYWGAGDLINLMISESAPTNLRSSVLSSEFIAMGIGIGLCYVVGIPLITWLGNAVIGTICICFALPGFISALIVLMTKTHDTTGVDLDKVTGCEWD
ncbi:MAG: MFS transporter [Clostridia bacterium]|nr:MFS transporter [Clostridia bacterium]